MEGGGHHVEQRVLLCGGGRSGTHEASHSPPPLSLADLGRSFGKQLFSPRLAVISCPDNFHSIGCLEQGTCWQVLEDMNSTFHFRGASLVSMFPGACVYVSVVGSPWVQRGCPSLSPAPESGMKASFWGGLCRYRIMGSLE